MRPDGLAAVFVLLACSVGCVEGEPPLALGPKPKLVGRVPEDSEGLGCDTDEVDCGVPANQPLSFTFDRWLLPNTATRQSLAVWVDGADSSAFLKPEYELLTRTVTYRPTGGLGEGLVYLLTLVDASTHDYGWGFQSYDRRPLERRGLQDPIVFRTGLADPKLEQTPSKKHVCRDALKAFSSAGCTSCHGSRDGRPAAGLGLDRAAELSSAIGRVAHATDRSGESGHVSVVPERFGMNMALIDSSEPAYSYLLYRVLLRRDAYRNADGRFEVEPPSPSELEIAETWFSAPGPMPPLPEDFPSGTSPIEQVRSIERWIRDGADLAECD